MRAIVVIGSLLLSSGAFANVPKHEPLPQQELQPSLRGTWRPVMAPLAHVRFCMQNPTQCERRSLQRQSVVVEIQWPGKSKCER